jgi:hypothetical protein
MQTLLMSSLKEWFAEDLTSMDSKLEEAIANPGTAIKFDQEKPDYSLLPPLPIDEVAKVWTFGKKKYASYNWAKGFAWSRPLAAALRHIFAFLRGEDRDPESGLLHLAHAICCLMMVIEFQITKTGVDDRYKSNPRS